MRAQNIDLQKMARIHQSLSRWHLTLSLVPWIHLLFWTLYAFYIRHLLGGWPIPWQEPYVEYPLSLFDFIAPYLLLGVPVTIPLWFGVLTARLLYGARRNVWRASLVFALGWGTSILLASVDPVGFMAWWLD